MMSLSSSFLFVLITTFSPYSACRAWQQPSTLRSFSHRLRLQEPSVRLNYREGYHNAVEEEQFGTEHHWDAEYDPLRGGNYINNRRSSATTNIGPESWGDSSRQRKASSFWSTESENMGRDHVTLGPEAGRQSGGAGASSFWGTENDRRYRPSSPGSFHRPHGIRHPDERLSHDSPGHRDSYGRIGHQDSYGRQNAWSPRAQSSYSEPMSYFNDYSSRNGMGRNIDPSRQWNPRRTLSTYKKPESGISGPISSEAFQKTINTHTTLGPMPSEERRRLERKARARRQEHYALSGGIDGHGNLLSYDDYHGEYETYPMDPYHGHEYEFDDRRSY